MADRRLAGLRAHLLSRDADPERGADHRARRRQSRSTSTSRSCTAASPVSRAATSPARLAAARRRRADAELPLRCDRDATRAVQTDGDGSFDVPSASRPVNTSCRPRPAGTCIDGGRVRGAVRHRERRRHRPAWRCTCPPDRPSKARWRSRAATRQSDPDFHSHPCRPIRTSTHWSDNLPARAEIHDDWTFEIGGRQWTAAAAVDRRRRRAG